MRHHGQFLWNFLLFALPFWSAEHKWMNRGRLALIAALTVAQVAVQVGLNSWSAKLYNAIEGRHLEAFLELIVQFVLYLVASILVFSITLYTKRRLQFAWRVWITRNTLSVWMAQGQHYQLGLIASEHDDNPDGRIAEDIRVTTELAVDLGQSLFYCILLFCTFVTCCGSSPVSSTWTSAGRSFAIPGFMVFIALVYSAIGTSLALWAGFPLVGASNLRQTVEANFRFGLARAREYSESIALIGGDDDERTRLQELLRGVRRGWERQTYGLVRIIVFTTAYGVLANPFPLLVAAPRYILGLITLGTLMQMAQAFSQVTAALAFPVDNLSGIALWRASVERVMALQDALRGLQEKLGANRIEVKHEGTSLQLAGVQVMEHDGTPLTQGDDGRDPPRRTCADRRQDAGLPQAPSRRCRALAMGRRNSDAAGGRANSSSPPTGLTCPWALWAKPFATRRDLACACRTTSIRRCVARAWASGPASLAWSRIGRRCSPWRNSKGSALPAWCFIGPTGFSCRRRPMRSIRRASVKSPSCWPRNFRRQRSWPLVEPRCLTNFSNACCMSKRPRPPTQPSSKRPLRRLVEESGP